MAAMLDRINNPDMLPSRGAQHRQGFIDVLGLRVAGNDSSARVRLFNLVVPVIDVDRSSCGGRFINPSPEGIVFEGDGPAAARRTALIGRFSKPQA